MNKENLNYLSVNFSYANCTEVNGTIAFSPISSTRDSQDGCVLWASGKTVEWASGSDIEWETF